MLAVCFIKMTIKIIGCLSRGSWSNFNVILLTLFIVISNLVNDFLAFLLFFFFKESVWFTNLESFKMDSSCFYVWFSSSV